MSDKSDYRIRFFKAHGTPLEIRSVSAESVAGVVRPAEEIAAELRARNFTITPLPPKILPGA
jgi:hypothetical protein